MIERPLVPLLQVGALPETQLAILTNRAAKIKPLGRKAGNSRKAAKARIPLGRL
jgi:hypothetical protein